MIKKKKVEMEVVDVNPNGHDSVVREIAEFVLDPKPEKLAGMTKLPLDQIRPCSFARDFVDEMVEQCKLAKESQKLYSANWGLWHSEAWDIPNIGMRIPADPELPDDYFKDDKDNKKFFEWVDKQKKGKAEGNARFFPEGYKPEIVDVNKDRRFKIPAACDTLVFKYLNQYYLHRRSTAPVFSEGAFELATRQLEAKPPESSDDLKRVINQ